MLLHTHTHTDTKKVKHMEAKEKKISEEDHAMNGGNAPLSYTKNSAFQRRIGDTARLLIHEAIVEKLDLDKITSEIFFIADLGCSVAPNTFLAVQNIVEAVEMKWQSQGNGIPIPEIHVHFSDTASNDFNSLFTSLPVDRKYYVSGVPGSFYGRLFPRASLHIVHSSFALQWLSQVPKEVIDKNSPCWNKGRIYYSHAGEDVVRAYSNQFSSDMDCFLKARALEVVEGGLVAIVIPSHADEVPDHLQVSFNMIFHLLESCLLDLAKEGKIDEEKVDSFNLPVYNPSIKELEAAVERNGCFSLERMENLPWVPGPIPLDQLAKSVSQNVRAVVEGLIREQFGSEILDELFELLAKKREQIWHCCASADVVHLFVLLKRKAHC